jgi:transcriptional regulator NrdR family protein
MANALPKGLYCPVCHGVRLTMESSKKPTSGAKIRYRKCTVCGSTLKTRETIVHVCKRKAVAK